jgi:outer membrane protein OmpA-like peptidoglycan-associated protein
MRALIFIFVLAVASLQQVHGAVYSNFINEGAWRTETSPLECRLTNTIPFYGEAIFRTRAGGESAEFFLEAQSERLATGEAQVVAEAPVWRPNIGSVSLGEVPVTQGARPIRLDQRYAEHMLSQLHQGREIVIVRDAWYAEEQARLAITSIAFRQAYRIYLGCLAGLLPINFDQIKRTAIYFEPGQAEELSDAEREKLNNILRYAQVDTRLKEFYVDGHTDSVGTREDNLQLSEKRARLIVDYLVQRGLPEERIVTRWHGERYPVASNQNHEGRAQNRRVTIRLERVEPVKIPPLATSATP